MTTFFLADQQGAVMAQYDLAIKQNCKKKKEILPLIRVLCSLSLNILHQRFLESLIRFIPLLIRNGVDGMWGTERC